MMTNQPKTPAAARFAATCAALTILAALTVLTGCEQPLAEGETYHKKTIAWPLFDIERSEGVTEQNIHWKKEKGDAIAWLSSWEKEEHRDKKGFVVYRKERSTFFPLWSTEIEETEEYQRKWGSVLMYPYRSDRKKMPETGGS